MSPRWHKIVQIDSWLIKKIPSVSQISNLCKFLSSKRNSSMLHKMPEAVLITLQFSLWSKNGYVPYLINEFQLTYMTVSSTPLRHCNPKARPDKHLTPVRPRKNFYPNKGGWIWGNATKPGGNGATNKWRNHKNQHNKQNENPTAAQVPQP